MKKKKRFDLFSRKVLFAGACCAALMTACSVEPEPVGDWDRAVRVDTDIKEMFTEQRYDVISRPLSMYDAMARAVKYNLEARLSLMEAALAQKEYNLTSLDMLPVISADAGYGVRNNYDASVSKAMRNGVKTPDSFAWSDKKHGFAGLQASWNVLDFGVSYFKAKQYMNDIMIAKENRRKIMQSLLQEVRETYWRALAAERLSPRVTDLTEAATYALEEARAAEKESSQNREVLLHYQMTLMEILRDLNEMDKELHQAREKLTGLMNLKPGTRYRLVGPEKGNYTLPEIRTNLDRLEWLALMNRPELRQEDYKVRSTRMKAKESLVALLPNLNVGGGLNYDSDKFLYNNTWMDAAVKVGWNLLNPMRIASQMTKYETQEAVDNLRRQTIAMAVMTQVHLGWGQYQGTKEKYQLSVEIADVAGKLAEGAAEKTPLPEAEKVLSQARALFAEMQEAMSFAEFQSATGNIYRTIGVDALPEDLVLEKDTATLSRALERVMAAWDLGRFTNEDYPNLPPVPMRRPPIALTSNVPVQKVYEDSRFVLPISPAVFAEAELGDDVVYTAKMRSGARLPNWMFFDAKKITLSGSPMTSNEGLYEIVITAKNPKKQLTAYIRVVVNVLKGFRSILNLRGAEEGGRATVIRRCDDNGCLDNTVIRPKLKAPGKVIIKPIPKKTP